MPLTFTNLTTFIYPINSTRCPWHQAPASIKSHICHILYPPKKTVICHPQVFLSSPQNGNPPKSTNPLAGTFQDDQGFGLEKDRATADISKNSGQYQLKKGICQRLILWLLRLIFWKGWYLLHMISFFRPQKGDWKKDFEVYFSAGPKKKFQ